MSYLKNFCEIITKGTTPSTYGYSFKNSGIKFIRSENITDSRIINKVSLYISKEANEKLKRSILLSNDVLMSIAGAYLGKLALITEIDLPANTNQAVAIIRTDKSKLNPLYLYYYLSSYKIQCYINNVNAQSAQPNINLQQIGDININVPNLNCQQHIVDIIGSLDDKIENNNKIIEKMRNLLSVKTNELLLYKTKKIQLNDIIEERKEKADIELVPYSVINTGKVIIQNEQFNKEIAKNTKGKYKKIEKDYFVYNPSRINIGSVGVMEDEIGCVSPIYVIFKCIKEYKIYLHQLMTFNSMIKEINKRCSGSVRQALSFNDLCSIEIFDIEKEKLKIYNKYCDSIIRLTKKLEQENKLLEKQKKLYLAKFF